MALRFDARRLLATVLTANLLLFTVEVAGGGSRLGDALDVLGDLACGALIAGGLARAAISTRGAEAWRLVALSGLALWLADSAFHHVLRGAAPAPAQTPAAETTVSSCPQPDDPIVTDRPDVTNSSLVVPRDSLQVENGVNGVARSGATRLDATNSRLRLGVADCLELLLDLPNYVGALHGGGSGFGDLAPALKRQLGPLAGGIELSATVGLGLPTGATRVAGRGYQPYLQFPWSRELVDGWAVSGMVTGFWAPDEARRDFTLESNLVISRELARDTELFVEFVGDYPRAGRPIQEINAGGAWRLSPTRQLDFHAGFGLDRDAPRWFLGVGYSFRFDRLL
jgi:hypothetical protein